MTTSKSYWTEKGKNRFGLSTIRCACARDGVSSLAQVRSGDRVACLCFDDQFATCSDSIARMDQQLDELLDLLCWAGPGNVVIGMWAPNQSS